MKPIYKILLFALLFSILVTAAVEVFNYIRGFREFTVERELILLVFNFVIGIVAGYASYKLNQD